MFDIKAIPSIRLFIIPGITVCKISE